MADELGLVERIEAAEVVVTGEGFLDDESFDGKVVGGVLALARRTDRPVLAVVGEVLDGVELPDGLHVVSLVERCGRTAALEHTGRGDRGGRAGRLGRARRLNPLVGGPASRAILGRAVLVAAGRFAGRRPGDRRLRRSPRAGPAG